MPMSAMSGGGGTSGGSVTNSYNAALSNLQQSLSSANNAYSGAQMQLGQQLNQNQGSVAQNLTSQGLGNTTLAETMSQAPIQTYNQGMLNTQNAQQLLNSGIYGQMAGVNTGAAQTYAGEGNAQLAANTSLQNAQNNSATQLGLQSNAISAQSQQAALAQLAALANQTAYGTNNSAPSIYDYAGGAASPGNLGAYGALVNSSMSGNVDDTGSYSY